MQRLPTKPVALAGLSFAALIALSACSNDSSEPESPASAAPTTTSAQASADTEKADAMANLIGDGCAAYADLVPTGAGSVTGMSQNLVTVAASDNPMLTTLTQALTGELNPDVNLVETLNNGEFTVFAPTNDAFAKLPEDTIGSLKTDADTLTKILTYHVVPGQAAPEDVVGTHTTVEGSDLTVTGSGSDLKVNDAGLVCGGIETTNATVYMIDTVLSPPES